MNEYDILTKRICCDNAVVEYGFMLSPEYESNSGIVFIIKTGIGGSVRGYKDKYIDLSKYLLEKYCAESVVVISNPQSSESMPLDKDMDFIKEYIDLEHRKVYFIGVSNGAMQGLFSDYGFQKVLLANLPLSERNLNPVIDRVYEIKNKIFLCSGEDDPYFLQCNVFLTMIDIHRIVGCNHYINAENLALCINHMVDDKEPDQAEVIYSIAKFEREFESVSLSGNLIRLHYYGNDYTISLSKQKDHMLIDIAPKNLVHMSTLISNLKISANDGIEVIGIIKQANRVVFCEEDDPFKFNLIDNSVEIVSYSAPGVISYCATISYGSGLPFNSVPETGKYGYSYKADENTFVFEYDVLNGNLESKKVYNIILDELGHYLILDNSIPF